jgi:hypothetical protein
MTSSQQKQSLQTHISIENGSAHQHNKNENTPLLTANGSVEGTGRKDDDQSLHGFLQRRRRRRCLIVVFMLIFMVGVVGSIALSLVKEEQTKHDFQVKEQNLRNHVHIDDTTGECTVTYSRNLTTTDTFADLAKLMLPVWLEASFMAINVLTPSVEPSNVKGVRKCLLTTRDLLDVFSPVYTNYNTQWKDLRGYYKDGYEIIGPFQDLDHGQVTYDATLWKQRRRRVLHWKAVFQRYTRLRHNRLFQFLSSPSPNGCYDHKESHLFWQEDSESEMDDDESSPRQLQQDRVPCGNDLATPSLQGLATLQLNHALAYLQSILQYNTVLSREHQLEYHNLRKEMRSFLDEYSLFDFVLFPNVSTENREEFRAALVTLVNARNLLGELNDDWEKYNLYKTRNIHPKEQKELETQIAAQWTQFKEWAATGSPTDRLSNALQTLLDMMDGTLE